MEEKDDLIEKYTSTPYPPLEKSGQVPQLVKTQPSNAKEEYKAIIEWGRGNKAPRFIIVCTGGDSHLCSYASLVHGKLNASCTLMTLTLPVGIFILEGVNLDKVRHKFLEERVKELRAFNPERHNLPEEEEPVIEKLELEEYQS